MANGLTLMLVLMSFLLGLTWTMVEFHFLHLSPAKLTMTKIRQKIRWMYEKTQHCPTCICSTSNISSVRSEPSIAIHPHDDNNLLTISHKQWWYVEWISPTNHTTLFTISCKICKFRVRRVDRAKIDYGDRNWKSRRVSEKKYIGNY